MNAIILAAGLGSRFKEVTKTKHKALLPIGNVPNIERNIQYLQAFGIKEIYIVVGYLSEQFEYLKEQYEGVELIMNPHYREYNSIYTFSKVLEVFGDSYVMDADVVLFKNIFKKHSKSTYYTVQRTTQEVEWIPMTNAEGRVMEMNISNEELPSMLGISYWSKEDAKIIQSAYKAYMNPEQLSNSKLYWDNIPVALLSHMDVTTYEVESQWVDEMDTVENYKNILEKHRAVLKEK
ncbi:MAG: NTP transferase domain-containing protein [Cellulosilyticum sp.]|nr:NTP transferase domain-containing protein [Cellulosilyticum sp.]